MTDSNASLSEQIFDIPMAEIESIEEPNSIADDLRRKSITLVSIHWPVLAISASLFVSILRGAIMPDSSP